MSAEVERIIAILHTLEDPIRAEYKAEIIGLFGSYVRGEQTEASDLDVLVRFYEGASLFDFVGLADFLEENLGVRVDVVSEGAIRPELRDVILGEMVMV